MFIVRQDQEQEVAIEKVVRFAEFFGRERLYLACHAAFPIALTPDLLYQIHNYFVPEVHWTSVADVLLSSLCREVGHELYEMDLALRNLLLEELQEDFGAQRLIELADFLSEYVSERLISDDPSVQNLALAQEWTVLAYKNPQEAAQKFAESFKDSVDHKDSGELVRLSSLVESLLIPLGPYIGDLMTFSRGIACWVKNDSSNAANYFRTIPRQIRVGNVILKVPLGFEEKEDSAPNFQESDQLLSGLLEEAHRWEGMSARGTKLGPGSAAIKNLIESEVRLGNPKAKLMLLTEETFKVTGSELNSIYRQQMQDRYDFYFLTLRVELRPRPTAQFWRLSCALDFGPKGNQEPILQSVFPNENWSSVLSAGMRMDIGLNSNLDWTIGVDPSALTAVSEQLPDEMKGKVTSKNEFKAYMAMPDYKYKLGRFEIFTMGVGSSTAYWRIQSQALKKGMVEFATVFKVPKAIQEVELIAKVWAEPNFNWLLTDVRDVVDELSDRLKQLFRNKEEATSRFVRWDAERWQLLLPK